MNIKETIYRHSDYKNLIEMHQHDFDVRFWRKIQHYGLV